MLDGIGSVQLPRIVKSVRSSIHELNYEPSLRCLILTDAVGGPSGPAYVEPKIYQSES